jgi:transcriptional regulator with XRE-family HTH domain
MQNSFQAEKRAFGAAIREQRMGLKLSQEDFAEVCGLHRTYISQVERGLKNVSFDNIRRISIGLRLKSSELYSRARL